VLVRRESPVVAEFNRLWWSDLLRGCGRDQISFSYAAWRSGLCLKVGPPAGQVVPMTSSMFGIETRIEAHKKQPEKK